MKLEFSAQAADRYGFCQAILADGKKISYTNFINDEYDKPETSNSYAWKDKMTVYVGKDSDVVGYDLSMQKKPTDPTYGLPSLFFVGKGISELRDCMLNTDNNTTPDLKK